MLRAPGTPNEPPSAGIVSALLPDSGDEALWSLAEAVFVDGGVDVPVSPVDQLLAAFARRLLSDQALGPGGLVQLPRCRQRTPLMLAILSHLLCRQPPARLRGPVVLIGFDIDLASQLRALAVRNHRRMNLADGNPLSAHRLGRDGHVVPLLGSRPCAVDRSLIYFNTRVGEPSFACGAALVVIDGTTVKNPAARARALRWALSLGPASIVAIGDLGDDGLLRTMRQEGVVPSVLSFTDEVARELEYVCGRGARSSSTLSSAALLVLQGTAVRLHRIGDGELNEAVNLVWGSLAGKPKEALPAELSLPLRMLRNGVRLAADVSAYKSACVENPRPGEMPDVRRLDRMDPKLPPRWHRWQQDRLPALLLGVRALWRALEASNPKVDALWGVLDELQRTTTGTLSIRCHSRAAARATLATLSSESSNTLQREVWESVRERLAIVTYKERFQAGQLEAQVLTGTPPPWEFSLLCSVEATSTHVLCFDAEERVLARQGELYAQTTTGWAVAFCRNIGVSAPTPLESPITPAPEVPTWSQVAAPSAPELSLADVLDRASAALDPEDEAEERASEGGGTARLCVPVRLSDGRTWWCVDENGGETPVVVVTAGGPETHAVKDLARGQRILVPAGEGTESIHARLVAASRGNSDVRALDLILSQFRSAARAVLTAAPTRTEAIERVRQAGAEAAGQLTLWASGHTIAPHEPCDVEAVFKAAGRSCPDLRVLYEVANSLRRLNRWLGVAIAAVRDGRSADLAELRRIVGDAADEILDEFVVVQVEAVGDPQTVPGSFAGRIR